MLERLPATLLQRICIYAIEDVGWLHKPLELQAVRSTCKLMQAIGSKVAWRRISISRQSRDVAASHRALCAFIDDLEHPVYRALRDLYIGMPPAIRGTDETARITAQVDACLAEVLRRTTSLSRLSIGQDLVQSSASTFPLLTQQLLKNPMPSLQHLRLQEHASLIELNNDPGLSEDQLPFLVSLSTTYSISNDFQPIRLAGMRHLRKLHLALPTINLAKEQMSFPTKLWETLQDFSLDANARMLGDWKARNACIVIAESMHVGRRSFLECRVSFSLISSRPCFNRLLLLSSCTHSA